MSLKTACTGGRCFSVFVHKPLRTASSLWAWTTSCTGRISQGECVSHGADEEALSSQEREGSLFSKSFASSLMGLLEEGHSDCIPASSSPSDLGKEGVSKGRHLLIFIFLAIPQGV